MGRVEYTGIVRGREHMGCVEGVEQIEHIGGIEWIGLGRCMGWEFCRLGRTWKSHIRQSRF